MSGPGARLPYPGLRSFTREETDLFFGREGCVDAMVDRLAATRFLAVLGASGSGKSSLVRTGLLDALELGLLPAAGSRWLIADFRPGDRPIHSMAEALVRAASADRGRPPDEEEVRLLRAYLARGPRSIAEWCAAGHLPQGANLLILVDQFEELFRYSDYSEREEAEAFVALLLESARAPLAEARIYVTITMRSEYLGAAALIDGLAEAINRGLYLTPRMSREEVRQAITGPAAVCGFALEPALVNRLLNDLTSFAPWDEEDSGNQLERLVRRADQLPLMQHVLNRLYSIATARRAGGPVELKLDDYEALGGLRGALAAHGGEILDELLPEHREIAAAVFRALAAGSSLAEAVRRPTEFGELVEIAGGDERGVREVIEAFRAPGRNFLMPPRPARLRPETVVDISHESLVRQWDQFAAWLQQEIASAAAWRRLSDAAERHERGEASLLSGPALVGLANWWDTEAPSAAWAKRYGGDFDKAAAFLQASKREEARGQRAQWRSRAALIAALLLIVVIIPSGWYLWDARQDALASAAAATEARQLAEAERQKAVAAAEVAETAKRLAEAERQKAFDEAQRADAAAKQAEDAGRQAVASANAAAAFERQLAAEAQRRAEEERLRALEAAEAAALERQRAETERALSAQAQAEREKAVAAAERAQEERERADGERVKAEAAAALARTEQQRAEQERAKAEAAAALAETERARADQQRQIAEAVRGQFREANLELVGNRVWSLQREGAWDEAASLLAALWQLIDGPGALSDSWLIEPIRSAFRLQSLAEYPIGVDFLDYGGYEGWSGRSGRFRVYSLARKTEAGEAQGNNLIAVFDAMTGGVVGRFELPAGKDLGSELDLVAPEGERVAIVTGDGLLALWSQAMAAPVLLPIPAGEGAQVKVEQLAPVNTDARFALLLSRDSEPSEIVVVDPAAPAAPVSVAVADLARQAEVDAFGSVQLLGLVDGNLVLLLDQPVGRIAIVESSTGASRDLEVGGEVDSALLTPDGRVALALSCPGTCDEQDLVALDVATGEPLWVEKVPLGLVLDEAAAHREIVDGQVVYSAMAENEGQALIFRFGADRTGPSVLDARSHPRIGGTTFDGQGSYRRVDTENADGAGNAGVLALYAMPDAVQKLEFYVDRNSIALYRGGDTLRIAGVTRDSELLVYRRKEDGAFEHDPAFRPIRVGESSCIAAIAFGGDGRSLMLRRIDGALRYVAAIGGGPGVDWVTLHSDPESDARNSMKPAPDEIDCDSSAAADAESGVEANGERIVPVDRAGREFALLDMQRDVWWISVLESGEGGEAGAPTALSRAIGLPVRIGTSVRWIAGDPERGRIAMVSPSAVEVPVRPVAAGTAPAQGDGSGRQASTGAGTSESAPPSTARAGEGPQRLPRRGEPKAAAFDSDGTLVVAYAGGLLARFGEAGGSWSVSSETTIPNTPVRALVAADGRVAISDDRDFALLVDGPGAGAITRYGRIPGKPSALTLLPDGHVLSVEYNTDSAASLALAALPQSGAVADTARLVAMRSRLDEFEDSSIDALLIDRSMEAPAASDAFAADCDLLVGLYLARLEGRILGGEAAAAEGAPPDCPAGRAAIAAARSFAGRDANAPFADLIGDAALSALLQMAADGDATATRMLGAVLAHIAGLRGQAGDAAIAEDALRFGTGVPPAFLMNAAAGASIGEAIAEAARSLPGIEPTAHQLLAHRLERRINDLDALGEALLEFALAERLYRESDRVAEAEFSGRRRAALARVLPDTFVLDAWRKLQAWRPQGRPPQVAEETTGQSEPVQGADADMTNLDRLVERLPGSPLLASLRTELRRAAILAGSDPSAAADALLKLDGVEGAGWSPDLVEEYLELAGILSDSGDAANAFRLAAAAVRSIDVAFAGPIHANSEAAALFRRAAELMASTAAAAPRDTVVAEIADLALRPAGYNDDDTLPGKGVQPATTIAESVLDSAAALAGALAAAGDDKVRWDSVRGTALFWRGVLTNDHDAPKAVEILKASADVMRGVVDAAPSDDRARYRYAEALRWIGLSSPSTPETADTEREAIRQFALLWDRRASFAAGMLDDVGVGYGFALSGLAKTVRDVNLADLEDGRGAEDHAGWVLELLGIAADKDAVQAALFELGADGDNSVFVEGWHKMNSYGFPLGFLSGLVSLERGSEFVTRCDVLASDPYDAGRRAPGHALEDIAAGEAEAACAAAHAAVPGDSRAAFQLARAMSRLPTRSPQFLPLALQAAESGVASAYVLIGETLEEKKDERSEQAYLAAAQRVVIESFPILYPFLDSRAANERDRRGLDRYAEKAAALGVPEAHLALAGRSDDVVTKQAHLGIAARIWSEAGNAVAADLALQQAAAAGLDEDQKNEVEARVAEWQAESLIELPEDVGNI